MPAPPFILDPVVETMDRTGWTPPTPRDVDLRAVADSAIRDLIRMDPALWERVRTDPNLRRTFGFDESSLPAAHPGAATLGHRSLERP